LEAKGGWGRRGGRSPEAGHDTAMNVECLGGLHKGPTGQPAVDKEASQMVEDMQLLLHGHVRARHRESKMVMSINVGDGTE
jgi:hypothetical protein